MRRRFLPGHLHPAFLVLAVLLIAVPLLLALVEVPGESKVKDLLGVAVLPASQECGEVRHTGDPSGPWRSERRLFAVRDEARAARSADNIYLVGGLTSLDLGAGTAASVAAFERYDLRTRRYVKLEPLPARLNHVGVAAYKGDIYVVGGFTDQLERAEPTRDAWRYRTAKRRWEAVVPMPTARGGHGLAVVGDRLYAIGGRSFGKRLASVDIYDLRTQTWSKGSPMPTPRDHVGVGVHVGLIYAAGGRQEKDYSLGAFERYDPARDRWTRLPDLPRPVSSIELVDVNGRLVAAGGGDALSDPAWVSGQTWAYAPADRRWSQLAAMPQPKHGYAAAAAGGRLYVFGGSTCGTFRATDGAQSLKVPRS